MFWKKGKKEEAISTANSDEESSELPSCLEKSAIDWAAYRPNTYVAVKVWLPEQLDERLRQIADHQFSSRSVLVRNALFIYVYGAYAYLQMRQDSDGFYYHDDRNDDVRFSRSVNRAPQLGKNSINFKVWLPEALKNDLGLLADQAGITLSHFVREILVSHFMGHLELPERQELLQQSKDAPDDWPHEQGKQQEE